MNTSHFPHPITRWALAAACLMALAACGRPGPDLKAAFAEEIPKTWQVKSFKIEAQDDVGSKVSPQYRYRFRAEVSPRADLLIKVGSLQGVDILEVAVAKGKKEDVIGTAAAARHGDGWQTVFDAEKAPRFGLGRTLESFAEKRVIAGTSAYRDLLKSARTALEELARQIEADQAAFQKGVEEHQALSRELQDKARESGELLARERQRLQQQWQEAQVKSRQDNLAMERDMQAELQKRLAPQKQQLDAQVAELEKTYRLQVAEVQAQGQRIQQERTAQHRALREAYNTDQAGARKQMDRPSYTIYKAQADEKLRADMSAIDTQVTARLNELRTQEASLASARRAQLDRYTTAHREGSEAIRTALIQERSGPRGQAANENAEAIKAIEREQQQVVQRHQKLVQEHTALLQAKRSEVDQIQRRIMQARQRWQADDMLLAQLDKPR